MSSSLCSGNIELLVAVEINWFLGRNFKGPNSTNQNSGEVVTQETDSGDDLRTDAWRGGAFATTRTDIHSSDRPAEVFAGSTAGDIDVGPGTRIGDFEVVQELGCGGMGFVVKAVDTVLDRPVAIKIIAPSIAWNEEMVQRFIREARAMASIDHPAVMQILHWGRHQNLPYFVMPYTQGRTLHQLRRSCETLDAAYLIAVAKRVAAAMSAVHEAGLIHRDLKPSNIWIEDATGAVKILDFGLVRTTPEINEAVGHLTQVGMFTGTPGFMAPEQVTGEAVTSRTDLFSFGATLYAAVTGDPPFVGKTPNTAAIATASLPFPRLTESRHRIPCELIDLIHQCLNKNPDDRPDSAAEVLARLEQIDLNRSAPRESRSGWVAVTALAFLVLTAAWAVQASWRTFSAPAESNVAGWSTAKATDSGAASDTTAEAMTAAKSIAAVDDDGDPLSRLSADQRAALAGRPTAIKILREIADTEAKRSIPGDDAILTPLILGLNRSRDPTLRSDLIHLAPGFLRVKLVMSMLDQKLSPGGSAAVVQMLGGYEAAFTSAIDSDQALERLEKKLSRLVERCPDAELVSSCRWLMAKLGRGNFVRRLPDLSDVPRHPTTARWFQPIAGPQMVMIPEPGRVTLGSLPNEPGRSISPKQLEDLRTAVIDYSLAVSVTEITVGELRRVLPEAVRENKDAQDALPVRGISWCEAAEYCNRLSEQIGLPSDEACYHTYLSNGRWLGEEKPDALQRLGYRLPGDDEWEFLCRAGSGTPRHFGKDSVWLDRYAVVGDGKDSDEATLSVVGTRKPNAFGLFDTLGNISEWTNDRYWIDAIRHRRVRGGSVFTAHDGVRAAARYNINERMWPPHNRIGFRVVRTLP